MNSFKDLYQAVEATPGYQSERMKVAFLAAIHRKMTEQGVNAAELARRVDASPAYISKLFRGPSNLSIDTMAKLSAALQCNIHIHLAGKQARVQWFDVVQNDSAQPAGAVGQAAPGLQARVAGGAVVWANFMNKLKVGKMPPLQSAGGANQESSLGQARSLAA